MTKVYFCLFLFLLLVPPVQAWDFCVPNEDGVMLYYNIVSEDEGHRYRGLGFQVLL